MILTCPECQSRYLLNSAVISAGGQKVRCSKCEHVWHQDPEEPEEAAAEGAAGEGEQVAVEEAFSVVEERVGVVGKEDNDRGFAALSAGPDQVIQILIAITDGVVVIVDDHIFEARMVTVTEIFGVVLEASSMRCS